MTTSQYPSAAPTTLRRELHGEGILVVTLNRPEELNSFTPQMADELVAAFEHATANDTVRAVVVTGEGRAFCAGMDLSAPGNVFGLDETQRPTPRDLVDRLEDPVIRQGVRDTGGRVSLAVHACAKPVIAAINGPAVGVGATMTMSMDFRLASTSARMGFVFGKIGIVPEACSTYFLPRVVGMEKALELVYTGEILSADAALEAGLVRSIHAPEDLLPAAIELAERITKDRSSVAIALSRAMLRAGHASPLEAHRAESLAMFYTSIGDGKEGLASFLEKRSPEFSASVSAGLPVIYPGVTDEVSA